MKNQSIAILGMSPGNSYFNEETIQWLISATSERFAAIKVMIPDHPAEYTYRAIGEQKPKTKARLQGNAMRNRITNVLGGVNDITLDWKNTINEHLAYRNAVREILKLYKSNEGFRKAAQEATREVLNGKVESITDKKIEIGVKFLLCELAFLSSAKEILGNDVTYIYHRPWPIFSDFINGKFDSKKREIGFEIIAKES